MVPYRIFAGAVVLGLLGACNSGDIECRGCGQPAQTPAPPPPPNKVSGTVLDKKGNPVADVTVMLSQGSTTVTLRTDGSGKYTMPDLSGNNDGYTLQAAKDGWGFYPSVDDPSGAVTRIDVNGYISTVIRFPSAPNHPVSSANFVAYGPGDKVVSLPRTGQAKSYAPGDDAAAQVGVAWPGQRFADNGNGTVTDRLTGLIWLKDAGCLAPMHWTDALAAAAKLTSGACGLTDGSTAGQWRVPNANELESLVDVSQANPALTPGSPFANTGAGSAYWTSTTYMAFPANALAIRLTDGRWINGTNAANGISYNNSKAESLNGVWAVRSGSAGTIKLAATGMFDNGGTSTPGDDAQLHLGAGLTTPRFIDNRNGTLYDTVSGLTWLKSADCIKGAWADAIASINALANGQCGLTDGSAAGSWRMPNRTELASLADRAVSGPMSQYLLEKTVAGSTVAGFSNFALSDFYWTSTTSAADPSQAWTAYTGDFGIYNVTKTQTHGTLAVR